MRTTPLRISGSPCVVVSRPKKIPFAGLGNRTTWKPALRGLHAEGTRTVALLTEQQETLRRSAARQLAEVEAQAHVLATHVGAIDSRLILGEKPIETDLLLKQARTFYEQRRYEQSLSASQRAFHYLAAQSALLQRELGRYASPDRVARWQRMAKDTIEWSRTHKRAAIVVSKAERSLTLYRNGQKVVSYPVRLGFNGIKEKRYQGDGATPEGRYRDLEQARTGADPILSCLVTGLSQPGRSAALSLRAQDGEHSHVARDWRANRDPWRGKRVDGSNVGVRHARERPDGRPLRSCRRRYAGDHSRSASRTEFSREGPGESFWARETKSDGT